MIESPVLGSDRSPPEAGVRSDWRPRRVQRWVQAAWPLLILDGLAVATAWLVVAYFDRPRFGERAPAVGSPVLILAALAFVIAGNYARGLYAEARADRGVELVACARSCLVAAVAVVLAGRSLGFVPAAWYVGGAAALCFLLMLIARSSYRAAMTARRRANEAVRPVIVVGTNDEAFELCRLLDQDSAFGFRPWGVVGDRGHYDRYPFEPPYLGDVESIWNAVELFRIDHVFVARTALSASAFSELTRALTASGVQVAASGGLPSIDQRRLKVMPIAQMPVYCLGASGPSKRLAFVKRSVDIAVATVTLVASLPLMAITALAIFVVDGRPILFRQQRVGRNGVPFTMFKFRTMVPDAEVKVVDLLADNEREGPLFKLTLDPRVTRTGRLLRDSSLDELPQLINVLFGKMSLVGPRPALVTEVASFSKALLGRNGARPGMTGLWQVEAGDDPSFVLYQHLDLYYVENWSTALDLAILVATIPTVVWRTVDRLLRQRRKVRDRHVEASATFRVNPGAASPASRTRPHLVPAKSPQPEHRRFRHDVAVISANGRAALPLGLAFAKSGLSVVLHDPNAAAVDMMNRGRTPLRGGGERTLLRKVVIDGRLSASTDIGLISEAEAIVVVSGADPASGEPGPPMVGMVEEIAEGLRDGQLLVLENSLDPLVAQQVEDILSLHGLAIDVALCRERPPDGPVLGEYGPVPQILTGRTADALARAQQLFRARAGDVTAFPGSTGDPTVAETSGVGGG